jgi:hypothetical protein
VRLSRPVRSTRRHPGLRNRTGLPRRSHARQWRLFRRRQPHSRRTMPSPFGRALSDALGSDALITGGRPTSGTGFAASTARVRQPNTCHSSPLSTSAQCSPTPSPTRCIYPDGKQHTAPELSPNGSSSPLFRRHSSPRIQATWWQRRWPDRIDWRLSAAAAMRIGLGLRGTPRRVLCYKEQRILRCVAPAGFRGHLAPR